MPLTLADELVIIVLASLAAEGLMKSQKNVILVQWDLLETEVLKLGE